MKSLHDLNLNSLRIIESAARTGSFVRASEELLLTPSAVSQRIKGLEEQLGFMVFNRRNNAVVLTTEGGIFVARVRDALDTILAAGIEAQQSDRRNILKISALPTFTARWLLQRLPDFQDRHPAVVLNLSSSYAAIDFTREDMDVAIRYGNGRFPGLDSHLLLNEDLTPVCSPSLFSRFDSRFKNGTLQPKDLGQFTLLHSDTCRLNWKSWLGSVGEPDLLQKTQAIYFDSCLMSFEAASAGLGFAIANRVYTAHDVSAGKLVAPFETEFKSGFGWYLVYPRCNKKLAKVEQFAIWIAHEAMISQNEINEHIMMQTRKCA